MPNWCYTSYKIHGRKEVLSEIDHAITVTGIEQDKLREVYHGISDVLKTADISDKTKQDILSKVHYYGDIWLSLVLQKLGFEEQVIERRHQGHENFRGYILSHELTEDTLYIYCDTAWSESDGFRNMLNEKYGDTEEFKVFFTAEEPGCEYYWTNDPDEEGTCIIDVEDDRQETLKRDQLKTELEDIFEKSFATLEDALEAVKVRNAKADEDSTCNHIWIHEFSMDC